MTGDVRDMKNPKLKIIPFRSIKDCYLARQDLTHMSLPKGWTHAFYVMTIDRLYVLCAPSDEERKMWMAGFRYVIASTLTVQVIMKHNSKQLNEKLKQKTEQFQQKNQEVIKKQEK